MAQGLVEIPAGDDAHHAAVFAHAYAGVPVPLGRDEGIGDGGVGVDQADRPAHDLAGRGSAKTALRQLGEKSLDGGLRCPPSDDGRSRLGVASSVDGMEQRAHVDGTGPRAGGHEHPVFHADRLQEHLGVDQLHELVGDDAEPIDISGYFQSDRVHVETADPLEPHQIDHLHEHHALLGRQSAVKVALYERL